MQICSIATGVRLNGVHSCFPGATGIRLSCFASLLQKPETEEKTLVGELKTSPPPRSAPKKQLPSIPKNVLPITKPASPALSAQSTNGTHASYGPFYLEYSLLAE